MPDSMKNALLALLAVVTLVLVGLTLKGGGSPSAAAPLPAVTPAGSAAPSDAPTTSQSAPVIAFVGDSYVAGAPRGSDSHGFAYLAAASLGDQAEIDADPGAGYVAKGLAGTTLLDQAKKVTAGSTVVFSGGLNDVLDRDATPRQVRSNAEAAFRAVSAAAPQAKVAVLGPLWPSGAAAPAKLAAVRSAVEDAAKAAGTTYLPPADFMKGVGLLSDQRHPTVAGHKLMAQRLARALGALT